MSRKNKKKRFSRKFRKLHKIGKPSTVMVQGKPIVDKTLGVIPKRDEKIQTASQEILSHKETVVVENQTKPSKKERYLQFDEAKSTEIISNLKTVIVVSAGCLVLLGILYYLELRVDWVAAINTKINNVMEGWTW